MYTSFVDYLPVLRDAEKLFPEAIFNSDNCNFLINEPKTLFIVMKR